MNVNKHLMAVMAACLALIGLVLAIKVNLERKINPRNISISSNIDETLKTDNTFFSTSTVSNEKKSLSIQDEQNKSVKTVSKDVITAKAFLVADVSTGYVYLEHNPSMVLPVASMSKLVTAFAATDSIASSTLFKITKEETDLPSDSSNLQEGESFTEDEILFPLLLSSSNVAAEAIASSEDRTKFLELMTSYAWEVGMPDTFFADPSGLSPQNISTANDFLALAEYLYKSRPDILAITRFPEMDISTTTEHGSHRIISTHPLINDPGFIGGKTGRTPEAGETMLSIIKIENKPIAIIVLGSTYGNREADTRELISEYSKL